MNGRPGTAVPARLPPLAAGGLALVGGLYAALLLLDAPLPDTAAGVVGNEVAVVAFVACTATLAVRARRTTRTARSGITPAPLVAER
jgi:hypothetical protein